MTNYSVFNKSNSPLYTQSVNTFSSPAVEGSPDYDAAKSSSLYLLTTNNTTWSGGGNSLLLQVANGSGNTKSMYVSRIFGGATAASTFTLYSGGTITGGTTPTPFNTFFGSSSTSTMTTKQLSGTLGGTPTTLASIPFAAGLYSFDFEGGIVVPANHTLTVALGPGANTGSIQIIWWEY
ncbi:hypothetical protein [Cohnella sp. AR92]|uniref:hypothetical protein n=1 Tax=Cohnella sp. AR92 TaxID=648716 RepID=UPI000F8EA209|nr:hypothetical protein [Cohnella sp. AR92]RUS49101.1 hypothetical protein ELR57_01815 [Cohnella sp. AR92]